MKDYIIVGFGFAGVAFAHILEQSSKTFIIYNDHSQQSTLVSGALFNPVVLKRFTPIWRAEEQMAILEKFYRELEQKLEVEILKKVTILRKFASLEEQNNWFSASDKPILSEYLSPNIIKEISPFMKSPFGLGEVLNTGRIYTNKLLNAFQERLEQKHVFRKEKFDYDAINITSNGFSYKDIQAKNIVFCEGYGISKNPFFNYLPIQGTKGELLTFEAPDLQIDCVVKSNGFIFPNSDGTYKVGTTYNHQDKSNDITEQAKEELIEKLNNLIHCNYQIIKQEAAIRPTVLDRRPLVGIHPEIKNLYLLNGLGTRGSMLAPYTATSLYNFIENNIDLDKEMDICRFEKRFWKPNKK